MKDVSLKKGIKLLLRIKKLLCFNVAKIMNNLDLLLIPPFFCF